MTFAIQLMLPIGVRPGEIVEPDASYQSNKALFYKDIKPVYSQNGIQPDRLLHFKLEVCKGHREHKNHAYVKSFCSVWPLY